MNHKKAQDFERDCMSRAKIHPMEKGHVKFKKLTLSQWLDMKTEKANVKETEIYVDIINKIESGYFSDQIPYTEEDSIVSVLKRTQTELQQSLKTVINMDYNDEGYSFGVWITIRCGRCGKDYKTPFYLDDNDKCKFCKKKLYIKKVKGDSNGN